MEQLFELVHLVNPTGASLDETERSERYATKGGLQSLLIEQFPDALQAGDAAAAIMILDVRELWETGDVQVLARLAEAYLRVERDDGSHRFRKQLVLVALVDSRIREPLQLGQMMWSAARVEDVVRRARAGLGE